MTEVTISDLRKLIYLRNECRKLEHEIKEKALLGFTRHWLVDGWIVEVLKTEDGHQIGIAKDITP